MKISEKKLRLIIREKLKRSPGGSHYDERYVKATDKNLFLDRPTSHGGWPEGPSRGAYDDTPVNKKISGYLKSLGLLDESEEDE